MVVDPPRTRALTVAKAVLVAAAVYNIGGGKDNSCSILEAFDLVSARTGKPMDWVYSDEARAGDRLYWAFGTWNVIPRQPIDPKWSQQFGDWWQAYGAQVVTMVNGHE